MHPNPVFRTAPASRNLDFARERGFGTLCLNGPDGPLLAHVPFLLDADGGSLLLHLVRTNPVARALDLPQPAVLAVMGPEGYVSPDWYDMPDQVPTWNYVAVHLRGPLQRLPQDEMRDLLDRQSADFEARLAPKPPWRIDKLPDGLLERMMRQIVPCRMEVASVDGTWKLGQNKPEPARHAAARHVDPGLAALMFAPPGD